MRHLHALAMLLCIATGAAARADQQHWSCDIEMALSGDRSHRELRIDTEERSVIDGDVLWKDGAKSPTFPDEAVYVVLQNQRLTWGHRTEPSRVLSAFSLDLSTGV